MKGLCLAGALVLLAAQLGSATKDASCDPLCCPPEALWANRAEDCHAHAGSEQPDARLSVECPGQSAQGKPLCCIGCVERPTSAGKVTRRNAPTRQVCLHHGAVPPGGASVLSARASHPSAWKGLPPAHPSLGALRTVVLLL